MAATKRLDVEPYHPAGMASCHYGPKDGLGGVTLSIPLGERVLDLAQLIGGSYAKNGKDVTMGSDTAFFLSSGSEASIAVAHGRTQFVITWRPLSTGPGDLAGQQQLTTLAEAVATTMPTDLALPQQDIGNDYLGEAVDDELRGVADIVGGSATMSRGSTNSDTLNCDYLGPVGIVKASATRDDDRFIDDQIGVLRKRPQDLVSPPIHDDVEVERVGLARFKADGYLRHCCSMRFEFRPVNESTDHSGVFSSAQREFIASFVEAARNWRDRS